MTRKEFKAPTKSPVKVWSEDKTHCAIIYGDNWRMLPERLWQAAYAAGCISKDMAVKGFDKEQTQAVFKQEQLKFEEAVIEAMQQLLEEGDPEKVDLMGRPKTDAIGKITGKIPTAQLRNKLFKTLGD